MGTRAFPTRPSAPKTGPAELDSRSRELRRRVVRVFADGNRGHVGSALSLVEILRVLYDEIMRYDANNPNWSERDRFVLSKGHGCIALYVLLAEKGFFPDSELARFCKSNGILGGHPDHRKVPGVEASTGSLGHGLSIAIGFAVKARLDETKSRTFVVIGDGESNEGSIWEAALFAGKHRLSDLTVLLDYNKHQSYGPTSYVQDLEPLADKWRSFGFAVAEVDGHSLDELREVLTDLPLDGGKPSAIICHTVKGKGIDFAENNMEWHHKSRATDEEVEALMASLDSR